MTPDTSEGNRREQEWELLRALCSEALDGKLRRELLTLLAEYSFSDPIRQAVFDEVDKIGRQGAEILCQELPPRLTRRGFPDVDFDGLFAPLSCSTKQALESARALVRRVKRV